MLLPYQLHFRQGPTVSQHTQQYSKGGVL